MGWPVGSVVRPVGLTGELANAAFFVGSPPKRAAWSIVFCAVTRRVAVLPILERVCVGRSGVESEMLAQAAPLGAGVAKDWVPGARRAEARTVLPSRGRRRRVW